jgi:hypothetical protein
MEGGAIFHFVGGDSRLSADTGRRFMSEPKQFSSDEAKRIGDSLGLDWDQVDLEQFRMGLLVELEHGSRDPETNVTDDDVSLTGKIALAHLNEFPDYYTRLAELEAEAKTYWAKTKEGVRKRLGCITWPKRTPSLASASPGIGALAKAQ